VNTSDKAQEVTLNLKGLKAKNTYEGSLTSYSADNMDGENTLDQPTKYVPKTNSIKVEGNTYTTSVPAKTFYMFKIKK
jgi:alpha-L-arabinofuranosidase